MLSSSSLKKLLVVGACISAYVSYNYLPQALSIFDVSITMNRQQVIDESKKIITAHHLLSEGYEHAAYFDEDNNIKNYIELAVGGKDTFKQLLAEHVIEPYKWVVRWYKEGHTAEVTITFTPDGVPYSFSKKVPEIEEGGALAESEARKRAESQAALYWNIDFNIYKPFEYSKEEKPNKRVDHIFTYQRNDISLADEGKYRVKIIVSGDTVTTVSPFVFIPESFVRRYQEMRSENNTIITIAFSCYRLLYLFFGIVLLGGFLLYRRRLQYTYALVVAAIVSIGILGTLLSQWPFLFVNYNTALSKSSMWMMCALEFGQKTVVMFITTFLFTTVVYAIDRWGFARHESIWNFFTVHRAARRKMLWYVLGGYLAAVVKLAGASVIILFLTGPYVGWWAPAWKIVNPNILALSIPWLDPIVNSFSAGFVEELLFRALPLSVFALLGRYCKREKLFLVCGLFIQALVFTALHANYPMYPAYFRIVEMFPSALAYGLIYLRFGLIPGIIMHWIYDLILMSLPIMVSTASGMFFQKIMIVVLGLLPLAYVIYARYVVGERAMQDEEQIDIHNPITHEYEQPEKINANEVLDISYTQGQSFLDTISATTKIIILIVMASCVGIIGYKDYQKRSMYSWSLVAKEIVCNDSYERMKQLNPHFLQSAQQLYRLESHHNSSRPRSSFGWRTMPFDRYVSLVDDYLYPVAWNVRYARFDGTQAEKAEEYRFMYSTAGKLLMYKHTLPELASRVELSESEARKYALEKLQKMYDCDSAHLKEITCESIKKPSRLDWNFVFEDTSLTLDQGNARVQVTVAGNEISNIAKYIFIPEVWMRIYDQENIYVQMVSFIVHALLYILVIMGIAYCKNAAIVIFNKNLFGKYVIAIFAGMIALLYLGFSMGMYEFSTSVAWNNLIISYFTPKIVLYIIMSLFIAIACMCYRYSFAIHGMRIKVLDTFLYTLFFASVTYGMEMLLPRYYPALQNVIPFNSSYPLVFFVIGLCIHLVQVIMLMYLSTTALAKITEFGTRRKIVVPLGIFLIMSYVCDFSVYYLIPTLLALGAVTTITTCLYYYAIRYDFFTCINGYIIFVLCNSLSHLPDTLCWKVSLLLVALAIAVIYRCRKQNALIL